MRRVTFALILMVTLVSAVALLAQSTPPAAPQAPKSVAELIKAGEFQAAVDKGLPMVEAGTADFALLCNLGVAYFDLKDYPKAIEMYEKASVLDVTSTKPFEGMAGVYNAMGNDQKALETLGKVVALDPTKSELLFNYAADAGVAHYEKSEYDKAEPFMRKAVEMKPEDFTANLGLAQCLEFQKKYADAVPFFQKVLALNTEEIKKVAFMLKVAKCQYFGKLYADAVVTAEKILEARPNETTALLIRAGSFLELKDCAKAVPAAESFLAISKDNAQRLPVLKGMARCYYDQKKYKDAAAAYEQAFAINESDEDVLLYGGNSFVQLKQNAKAITYYKKLAAVAKDPALKASAQKNVKGLGG